MNNTGKRIGIFLLLVLVVAGGISFPVVAEDQTAGTVTSLTMAQLTVSVDATIAGWGYAVSDNPSVVHHTLTYTAVTGPGSTMQIAVDLHEGWSITATALSPWTVSGNKVTVSDIVGNDVVYIESHKEGEEIKGTESLIPLYRVTFDVEGVCSTRWVAEGSLIQKPDSPEKEGWVFQGWYTDSGYRWDFANDRVYSDITLYAQWIRKADACIVSFDTYGKTPNPEDQVVIRGGYAVEPVVPGASWFIFPSWWILDGWADEDGHIWNFASDRITEDTTLYAQWVFPWWRLLLLILVIIKIITFVALRIPRIAFTRGY